MDNNIKNEADLIKASMDGSSVAFEQIVRKYQALICAITYSATRNVEKSEELAQETFVRAWKNLKKLREVSKFKPWLCSITNNIIREHFKSHKRDILNKAAPIEVHQGSHLHTTEPADELISKEQKAVVALALEEIPELYRQPLVLYYRQEQSIQQVAAQLDLSEETVRTRLHRGRKMLKKQVIRMVENTLSGTKPGKAFTVAVMASLTGIAVKGTASAATATTSTSPAAAAGTSLPTIVSGLTAKLVITASIAAVVIISLIIVNKKPPQIANDNQPQPKPQIKVAQPDSTDSVEPAKDNDNNNAAFSSQLTSNEENSPAKPLADNDIKSDMLDGVLANVRIYDNRKNNPADYSMVKLPIKNRTVQFDSLKEKGDAILVLLAEDQENPEIRKQLSRLIYASFADPNLNPANSEFGIIFDKIPGDENEDSLWKRVSKYRDRFKEWIFEDLEGNLIENATVEVIVSRSKSNERKKVSIGQYKADTTMPRFVATGPIGHLEFIVSHPDYGISRICAHGSNPLKTNIITLPLINKNSQANSLAASGYVVDPEGNPVVGAEVSCSGVKTPAGSNISVFSRTVLTDNSGYFRYYGRRGLGTDQSQSGELIPQGSSYKIRIVAKDQNLEPFEGQVQSGKPEMIKLKYNTKGPQENFHTFSFYYGDKEITDRDMLENFIVRAMPHRKLPVEYKADQFIPGIIVPYGKCMVKYINRHKNEKSYDVITDMFPQIDITKDSPQQLVFRTEFKTYAGQILNAVTNKPMQGVFVVARSSQPKMNYAMFSDQDWESLQNMPVNPEDDDPGRRTLKKVYTIRNVTRTDANGRFKITTYCRPKTQNRLEYFAKDFIGINDYTNDYKPNEEGIIEIPTRKLFPAAKVTFLPNIDARRLARFRPEWIIDEKKNSDSINELFKIDHRRPWKFSCRETISYDMNAVGNDLPKSIYVPAGVSLELWLFIRSNIYDNYVFDKDILLSHGQTIDFGQINISKKIYVYVKVVDQQDNPLEGYAVKPYIDGEPDALRQYVSDKKGICELMVPPYSTGRLAAVIPLDQNGNKVHEIASVPFEIKGHDDEIKTYVIKIPEVK